MDKIWYRNPFEVGAHWPLWLGWKNRMTMQDRQKSNAKKIQIKKKKAIINPGPPKHEWQPIYHINQLLKQNFK